MAVGFPHTDKPLGWSGAADGWDTPAGKIVSLDYFDTPSEPYVLQSADFAASVVTNVASITLPNTPTVGNDLLLAVAYFVSVTRSTPSGWTLIDAYEINGVGIALYRRTVVVGDGAVWNLTVTTSTDFLSAAILEIVGGDLASAQFGHNLTNGSGTHTTASLTPTTIPTLPIVFASQDDAAAVSSDTITAPSGWTVEERAFPDYHALHVIAKNVNTTDTSTAISAAITGVYTSTDFGSTIVLIPVPSSGTAHSQTPSDTTTLSDSVAKSLVKALADTTTLSDTKTITATHPGADTTTLSDSIAKSTTKPLADTVTLTDSATPDIAGGTLYEISPADAVSLSDELVKTIAKTITDTTTLSDAQALTVAKAFSDSVTLSDTQTKTVVLTRRDTTALADHISFPGLVGVIVYPRIIVLLNGKLVLQLAADVYLPL